MSSTEERLTRAQYEKENLDEESETALMELTEEYYYFLNHTERSEDYDGALSSLIQKWRDFGNVLRKYVARVDSDVWELSRRNYPNTE